MSIQKKIKKKNGKDTIFYYPVLYIKKYTGENKYIWGTGYTRKSDAKIAEANMIKDLEENQDTSYCNAYLSVFDNMEITKISAKAIQKWVNLMSSKYAPKTTNMAFNLLSQIFEYAISPLHLLKSNPCKENIQRPRIRNKGIESDKYWSEEELKHFINHPYTMNDSYYRMYLIHSTFGMRPQCRQLKIKKVLDKETKKCCA